MTSKCVLCGEYFSGAGHNPDPISETGVCCDYCNTMYVIPCRDYQYELLAADMDTIHHEVKQLRFRLRVAKKIFDDRRVEILTKAAERGDTVILHP